LPVTILVWLTYILPLWAVGEIKYEGRPHRFIWVFENPISPLSKYDRLWKKWSGWSGPCVYIYKKHDGPEGPLYDAVTRKHELKHCADQFNWGIFFYPAYLVSSAWVGIKNLWNKDKKHMYINNYFEKRARKEAGQHVNIPRDKWPDGPEDFNPWL